MDDLSTPLAFASLGIAFAVWLAYLIDINRNAVAEMPVVKIALQMAAVAGAVVAMAREPSTLVVAPSAFSIMIGGLFLFLITQRKTPIGTIQVAVGDTLLPISAKNSDGSDFESASLDGQRILLKFFRGSW